MRGAAAFLLGCAVSAWASAGVVTAPPEPGRVLVGAIRWDAWHGPASEVGLIVEKTLAPAHWHYRLPFFGRVTGENAVEVRGTTPEIMEQEIAFAHQAGLDYWAFVIYPEDNALSLVLKLYLASEQKHRVNFCLNLQGGWEGGGGREAWPAKVRRYVEYFREASYQCVADGRPLIYLYSVDGLVGPGRFASWEEARAAFQELRARAQAAGAGNPYIVAQGWSPETLKEQAATLGLDAIGAYASNAGGRAAPYAELAAHTQRWWDAFGATGCDVVPLVTAGWDMRPRVETPVPWVKDGNIQEYYEAPAPDELGEHLEKAITWCRTHPETAKANTVLIYAWNEFDEGGWICPTLSEGAARLDAIGKKLRKFRSAAPHEGQPIRE